MGHECPSMELCTRDVIRFNANACMDPQEVTSQSLRKIHEETQELQRFNQLAENVPWDSPMGQSHGTNCPNTSPPRGHFVAVGIRPMDTLKCFYVVPWALGRVWRTVALVQKYPATFLKIVPWTHRVLRHRSHGHAVYSMCFHASLVDTLLHLTRRYTYPWAPWVCS
jgi:hypothetical protein